MEHLTKLINLTLVVVLTSSIGLQILMNYISSKINYKLDKKHYIVSLLLNPVCTFLIVTYYRGGYITLLLIIITTILISACMIDWKYQDLPDSYNLIVAVLSIMILVLLVVINDVPLKAIVPNIITAFVLFLGFFILAIISGESIGGGDVKLMGAVGFLFHYSQIPQILIYSFFPGALFAIMLLVVGKKKKEDKFAFGPFLVLGVIATLII